MTTLGRLRCVVTLLPFADLRPLFETRDARCNRREVSLPSFENQLSDNRSGSRFEIDFRAGGTGQETLIAGWSHPEAEYTWMLGQKSVVHLPVGALECDYTLKLRAGPMVQQGIARFQRLHVAVNGTSIARLVLRAPAHFELYVPAEALKRDAPTEIVFQMPDARAPSEPGGGGDTRELGVWLSALQFAPLDVAAHAQPGGQAAADKAMLMDLQSLGENCELGFVQRIGGFPSMSKGVYLVEDLDGAYWPMRGGGLAIPNPFIERSKTLVDSMNSDYQKGAGPRESVERT